MWEELISGIGNLFSGWGGDAGTAAADTGSGWFASGGASKLAGDVIKTVAPVLLTAGASALANQAFGQTPEAVPLRDVRTPDVKNAYATLVQDYQQGQAAPPLWNALEEEDIRRRVLAEAARSGVQDSGQTNAMVNRALSNYRMQTAQQHEANQIARAGQIAGGGAAPMQPESRGGGFTPIGAAAPRIPVWPRANDTVGQDANQGQPVSTNPAGGGRGATSTIYRNPYS